MSAVPAMALSGAVTYVIIDFLESILKNDALYWLASIGIFYALYKVARHFLNSLKE